MITSTDQNTSSDAVVIYDSFRRKGELVISENGFTFRRVYYFDEDEILLIISKPHKTLLFLKSFSKCLILRQSKMYRFKA